MKNVLYLISFCKGQYWGQTHLHSSLKLSTNVHPTQICADFDSMVGVEMDEQPISTRGPSTIVARNEGGNRLVANMIIFYKSSENLFYHEK